MGKGDVPPDELRCRRTDGRDWRCTRPCMEGRTQCELHHLQALHRQQRQTVPEALKLKKRRKNTAKEDEERNRPSYGSPSPSSDEKTSERYRRAAQTSCALPGKCRIQGKRSKKNGTGMGLRETLGRALSLSLKKMKMRKKDLKGELVRIVVGRELERRAKSEALVRDYPNGVMLIAGTAGSMEDPFKGRVGSSELLTERRPIRSKNAEPAVLSTLKAVPGNFPFGKHTKHCHQCRRSDRERMIRCSSCKKKQFCKDCIEKWYSNMSSEELKNACPLCRNRCCCSDCMYGKEEVKGCAKKANKVSRIRHAHYMTTLLLPILKQLNKDQISELEIESKLQGVPLSEVQLEQVECTSNEQLYCDNCKGSIVDLHRNCSKCSYNLCLSCCQEFRGCCQEIRKSKAPKAMEPLVVEYSRRPCTLSVFPASAVIKQLNPTKSVVTNSPPCSTVALLWKSDDDGNIPCPPKEIGGCGHHNLCLKCIFPSNWIHELEVHAEEASCSYDFSEMCDSSFWCSLCFISNRSHSSTHLRKAASRNRADDNYLYCPTVRDIQGEDVEHFQKHWRRGHPVIVRDVLQETIQLSWDPSAILHMIGKKNGNLLRTKLKMVKAINCLDWNEMDINVHQYFEGYFKGRFHYNLWPEMLKLQDWLHSDMFEELLPLHKTTIMNSLPFHEYTNPDSGLLNLVAKLPNELKPRTNPKADVAYGFVDTLGRGDSVDTLHFEMFDMISIMTHATEVPISLEQHVQIQRLKKKHRAQDIRELTEHLLIERTQIDEGMLIEVKLEASSAVHVEGTEQDSGKSECLCYEGGSDSSLVVEDSCLSASTPRSTEDLCGIQNNKLSTEDHDRTKESNGTSCSQSSKKSEDTDIGAKDLSEGSSTDSPEGLVSDACGAQWDVFRREDVPKLIEYLRKYSYKFRHASCATVEHVIHPIFDQCFFLDASHLRKLKNEYAIEPWSFEHNIGETVMIPAGCPYQVRNLKSNSKVSMHFVSPESVNHCIQLADELRSLPWDHKAKDEKSYVTKMALYGIKTAVEELHQLTSTSRCTMHNERQKPMEMSVNLTFIQVLVQSSLLKLVEDALGNSCQMIRTASSSNTSFKL